MTPKTPVRDHFLPPDRDAFRRAEPPTGRMIVIAPTRAACETIERALYLQIETLLEREHGAEIRDLARRRLGFGIVAGTGTGKTLAIRMMASEILRTALRVGVVNREREATPQTPTWNVVIVTTGIARRWFQGDLILSEDTIVVDEIHQTSAELELCLALGKRVGCRFIWLSATVDPAFYRAYLDSAEVLETTAFDRRRAARVSTHVKRPIGFLGSQFMRHVIRDKRGVAIFLPTRAEVEDIAMVVGDRWPAVDTVFYHGGEPIRVIRPFLDGTARKPFLLAMTAAGQSALNIQGLDTVVIYDAQYNNVIEHGRNVLTRKYLGANEILQMAGRVHGRVRRGEVHILTDRHLHFESLRPTPPAFQLAGDSERVALTAAALGVDLTDLELPVPLDHNAYRRTVELLTRRGIVEHGRLTSYGRDVEAMPVDRCWGELLVQVDEELTPFVAVAANVDSLHRMTRDERYIHDLTVSGSDHLTAYNIFADAVNEYGYLGEVYGLPRHLFAEELAGWAESRGVLVKAIEDIALGTASVYRTLELPLPPKFPRADSGTRKQFQRVLAMIMPFDLVIDEETADGRSVRVSRGSVCASWGVIAGTIRYFADAKGVARGAIDGTNLPLSLIRDYASRGVPAVEFQPGRRRRGLIAVRRTIYHGFELERSVAPLSEPFPETLAADARQALVGAITAGLTDHADQRRVRRVLDRLGEYWRRSGGALPQASPRAVRQRIADALESIRSYDDFLDTSLGMRVEEMVPAAVRHELDALPSSAHVHGDRVPLDYEIEDGVGVVRLRLREGQARRFRDADAPDVDRPLRFTVVRGQQEAIRADSLEELRALLPTLPRRQRPHLRRGGGGHRGRR